MSDFADIFGERIRSIRNDMKLSRASFANIVGMSEDALGLIERGESTPRLENLTKIASSLNIPASKLLDDLFSQKDSKSSQKRKQLDKLIMYLKTKSPDQIKMIHDISIRIFE